MLVPTIIILLIAAFAAASPQVIPMTTPLPDGWIELPNMNYVIQETSEPEYAVSAVHCANFAKESYNMAAWDSSKNACIKINTNSGDQILDFRSVGYPGAIKYDLLASEVKNVKPVTEVEATPQSKTDYYNSCERVVKDLIKQTYKCVDYTRKQGFSLLIKYKS